MILEVCCEIVTPIQMNINVDMKKLKRLIEDCAQTLSIFAEFAKVKNYDSAFEPWMMVRENCSKIKH